FIAPVIEYVSIPIRMESLTPVGMFVKMRAVEVSQPVAIRREVRRYPVENYPNSMLVKVIHHVHEVLRRSIARGWRKVTGGLISPRAIERMLHNRQQFNMGELHTLHVFG